MIRLIDKFKVITTGGTKTFFESERKIYGRNRYMRMSSLLLGFEGPEDGSMKLEILVCVQGEWLRHSPEDIKG